MSLDKVCTPDKLASHVNPPASPVKPPASDAAVKPPTVLVRLPNETEAWECCSLETLRSLEARLLSVHDADRLLVPGVTDQPAADTLVSTLRCDYLELRVRGRGGVRSLVETEAPLTVL